MEATTRDDHQAEIQRRQCRHKLMYSEIEARAAAKSMRKKRKARFTAYACRFCAFWHIGGVRSVEAGRRRAARRIQ